MLLSLLVCGYATKTFSSRALERASYDSFASVPRIERNSTFSTAIAAPFTSTATRFMVESVRYTAKLRGACNRPLRLTNDGGTTWVRSSIVNLTKLKQ
jgi:hypothetical protein